MKRKLLQLMLLFIGVNGFAQAPVIEGDLLLCPWTDGTASVTNPTYDSYQWYSKYWFTSDEFVAIDGATSSTFTYDWYNYDQSLFKVIAVIGGVSYESNTIQIDSWNWTSLFTMYEMNEYTSYNPDIDSVLLCEGASFDLSINNPPYDASIKWYKNGELIDGATSAIYTITGPGYYEVSAAPSFCPDNSSNSLGLNVVTNTECSLGIDNPNQLSSVVYPNPATTEINLESDLGVFEKYAILDMTGKNVGNGIISNVQTTISIASLANGIYILKLTGEKQTATHKIIKE